MSQTQTDRDRRERILSAIMKFARQRPGIDPRNYITPGYWNREDVANYRREVREVTADLADLREIIQSVRRRENVTAGDLIRATRAYSGRLLIIEDSESDAVRIEYCTGQYFPTEYRKACCAVLAHALWDYSRANCLRAGIENIGDELRKGFAREFSRRVARRYFN